MDIEMLGGEMFTWSDLDHGTAVADGAVARGVLAGYSGLRRRVLVAGPHQPALVEAAVAGFSAADVLVRSYEDAGTLRRRLPEDVRVVCGPLGSLPRPEQGYDLVVALAGLDLLHSAEVDEASWTGAATHLVELLSDDGELYLGFGNEVGVDRLLGLDPDPARDDAHWPHGRVGTDVPLDLRTLGAHLEARGLGTLENWACFGPRSAPTLAVPAGLLEERRRDPVLARLVEHAFVADAAAPVVKDVGRTARELVVHGLGAGIAPGWVLHHGRRATGSREALVLVGEPDAHALSASERHGAPGWEQRSLPGGTIQADGWLPSVPTVHELLAEACSAHDLRRAGELVRDYRDWIDGAPAATTLDGLALAGDALVPIADPAPVQAPTEVLLVRTLLVFAYDFLGRAAQHPWPRSASPEIVAWALAATAGVESDPELLRQAVVLDGALRGATSPSFSAPRGPDAFASVSEMTAALESYTEELAAAQAQLRWLLRNIHGRQRTVQRANRNIRKIQRSPEYRIGTRILLFRHLARKLKERFTKKPKEWTPPAGKAQGPEPLQVDPALVPPGYDPGSDVI